MIYKHFRPRFSENCIILCFLIILFSYAVCHCATCQLELAAIDPVTFTDTWKADPFEQDRETSPPTQSVAEKLEKDFLKPDMNSEVEKALNLFKGPERGFFLHSYRRSGIYRPAIAKALCQAGLPEAFSWLPLIGSAFSPTFMSRARALGLWQFIAATGYKCGLEQNRWMDERMNADKSTLAAIFHFAGLYHIFGDWMTVLAAYYCGESRVLHIIDTHQIDYRNDFRALYAKLPRTTAFNIPRFLAVLQIVKKPETYGFELPEPEPEFRCDIVTVNKQLHLKTLAQYLDVDLAYLRELNPELLQESTPDRPYDLRVPEGKGKILEERLDEIVPKQSFWEQSDSEIISGGSGLLENTIFLNK